MSNNPSSQSSGAFNIGNVVTAGLRLYRSHLKSYLGIALIATAWLLVPLLVGGIAIAAIVVLGQENPVVLGFGILFTVLLLLVLSLYCLAKSLMNVALIGRLAFGELTQQPETVPAARQILQRKMWGFLLIQIIVGLILFIISLALSFMIGFLQIPIVNGLALILGDTAVFSGLVLLISVIAQLIYLGIYFWIYARLFIPEVPIAVEDNTDSVTSIGRSWELSQNLTVRIIGVISVALLITLPLYMLAFVPTFTVIGANAPQWSALESDYSLFMQQFLIALFISMALFFVVNLLVLPFWQATKAVLYYDLRTRREGIDLRLRDRNPI